MFLYLSKYVRNKPNGFSIAPLTPLSLQILDNCAV